MSQWLQLWDKLQALTTPEERWTYLQAMDWDSLEADTATAATNYLQEVEEVLSHRFVIELLSGNEQQRYQALMILSARTQLSELMVAYLRELLNGELSDHWKSLVIVLLHEKGATGRYQVRKRGVFMEFDLEGKLSPFDDRAYQELRSWLASYHESNPSLARMLVDELHFLALERTPQSFEVAEYQRLLIEFRQIISEQGEEVKEWIEKEV